MAEVRQIRVVIVYTDELESISVDGVEMDDIDVIRNKPIRDWFSASNGRDGWEGLISEINKVVDDNEAELNFEFQGPKESKHIFEECIAKLGFGSKADGLETEDIVERNMEEAAKAEHRGLYKRALDCYVNAADYGNYSEAQYIVAEYYYRCYKGEQSGIDIAREDASANAVEYYEKAALQGHAGAQYQLYTLFSKGEGVRHDWNEAIRWLTMAAESGDAARQVELGDCYQSLSYENLSDDETPDEAEEEKNDGEAFKWYQKAADAGFVKAYIKLGECYEYGYGTKEDVSKAIKWYEKAAREESAEAQCILAAYYEESGDDLEKSFFWYEKAAKAGSLRAQFALAECYYQGWGVAENNSLAFEWFQKVVEHSRENVEEWEKEWSEGQYINDLIIEAQYKLGICYEYGYGVEIDQKKAFDRYLVVASVYEEDDYAEGTLKREEIAEAQNKVGYRYEVGKGIEKDLKKAFEWYQKSAENGNRIAQCNLGNLYENGKGVECNLESAYKWYKMSAEQGWPRGQFNIGWCYEYGRGTEKTPGFAYEWYKKSAENDYPAGQRCLGRCYDFAIGVEKDYTKAVEWYTKAAENSDVRASFLLGQCYEYGTGVDKSLGKAREYYEKAFAGGDSDAAPKLMLMEVQELCTAFNRKWSGEHLNRAQNLVTAYGLKCKKVYFSYDCTLSGNGKCGFAITDNGICDRESFGKVMYLSYKSISEVVKVSYDKKNSSLYLDKYRYFVLSASEALLQALVSLFGGIRDIAKKYLG